MRQQGPFSDTCPRETRRPCQSSTWMEAGADCPATQDPAAQSSKAGSVRYCRSVER